MAHHLQELIDFTPPWTSQNLITIRDRILPQIPVSDLQQRDYFECSLAALVFYAVTKDKQSKNFSINIAFYDADFSEKEVDEERLWGRDNIWVKVRIKGGVGKYFRSRYMATQLGVARVDWKRKTFRSLKVNSVKVAKTAVMRNLGTLAEKDSAEDGAEDWVISEDTKESVSPRTHSITRSKEELIKLLTAVTASDLATTYKGNGLKELINKAFNSLGNEETHTITRSEFILFWHSFLHEPAGEAVQLCEELGDEEVNIGKKEFAELFNIVMRKFTTRRPLVPVASTKANKARTLILEFLLKSGAEMQFLLTSESDFDHFARTVFDTQEADVWNKADFMQFFCGVLDVPVDIAFEAFKKASDSHQVIAFPNFKFYLQYFLELRPRNAESSLLWTWIVNDWMTNKTEDELNSLQTTVPAQVLLSKKLFETVHASIQSLNYDQYKLLQTCRAKALYQLPVTETETTQRFQSFAGILTPEQYCLEIQTAIQSVKELKADWTFSWAMTDAIGRLKPNADGDTLARFFWHYQSRFANEDDIGCIDCWRRDRSCYIADLTSVISMRKDSIQSLSTQVELSVEKHQRAILEAAEYPGKHYFLQVAQQSRECLISLVWESYRLLALAHFVYLAAFPYRPEHDFAKFMTYGRHMADVFHVEEQYVASLFSAFGSETGFLTEDGLAVCLKQVIKKFVRQL